MKSQEDHIIVINSSNLIKIVDDLLKKRLFTLMTSQNAYKGLTILSKHDNLKIIQLSETNNKASTLLEFAYNEYLVKFGQKSKVLK